ncbi:MAG: hypothetical protein ACKPKO_06945, partial [Candidatus Fonsibacter sp.]
DQTWLWDPVRAVRMNLLGQLAVLLELALALRLLVQVAMQAQGKTACTTSVPILDPLNGCTPPEYSTHGKSVALGALSSKLPTVFVLCVWAAYEVQRTPGAMKFTIVSLPHEAYKQ